jgi:light-regulated signal transduction histidine kinase (bacteriophytochrome)
VSKRWKKSLVVVLAVSISSGVAVVFKLKNHWHLLPFTFSVIISAWYGGLWPGLTATAAGFLVADYLFIEPTFAFAAESPIDWALIGLYVAIGIATSFLLEELRRKNEALEQLVVKLDQSNRDLERFSYTVAHDLSSPLRSIKTITEVFVAKNKSNLDKSSLRMLDLVVANAQRMNNLIHEILELAKTSQGDVEIVDVNTRAVVDAALDLLHDQIDQSRATVVVQPLPVVRANQVLLLRVFLNLIANAIKYRGEKVPAIEISAFSRDGERVFAIRDNGIGIDPKYHSKIFQAFLRLHGKGEGAGIGLAVCKQVVDRMHGRIWVESQLGKGSTFYFSLPA